MKIGDIKSTFWRRTALIVVSAIFIPIFALCFFLDIIWNIVEIIRDSSIHYYYDDVFEDIRAVWNGEK